VPRSKSRSVVERLNYPKKVPEKPKPVEEPPASPFRAKKAPRRSVSPVQSFDERVQKMRVANEKRRMEKLRAEYIPVG
jgi:hypothetical protein